MIKAMTVIHMVTQKRPSVIFPWLDATGKVYPSKFAKEYHRNPPVLPTEKTMKRKAFIVFQESTFLTFSFPPFTNPTRLLILKIMYRMASTSTTPNPITILIIALSFNQLFFDQM